MNASYFSRKLNLLNVDTVLNTDPYYDCGTKHLLQYTIDDKDSLLRLEGRYYKTKLKSKILRVIKFNDDHLIGQTIYLRSPVFCAGDKICRHCYGELYNNNKTINVGLIGATTISSRFTQNILSAKHSLMTKSQKIELPEDLENYLILDGNQLLIDYNNIKSHEPLYLSINSNELEADIDDEYENDEDSCGGNLNIFEELSCTQFNITTSNPEEVIFSMIEKNRMEMRASEYMTSMIEKYSKKKKYVMIPLDKLDDEEVLFYFDVRNHELTKTLNQVKGLLEQEDHGGFDNIEDLIYNFNRLLIDGKIYSHLIHAEIICRNLMRDVHDPMERPDCSKAEIDYTLFTVKKALMKHPSPIVSLSFERVEDQLRSVLTFKKRKSSMLDKLFMQKYKQEYQIRL